MNNEQFFLEEKKKLLSNQWEQGGQFLERGEWGDFSTRDAGNDPGDQKRDQGIEIWSTNNDNRKDGKVRGKTEATSTGD